MLFLSLHEVNLNHHIKYKINHQTTYYIKYQTSYQANHYIYSGVYFWAQMELASKCDAIVGHFGSG